jgi:hypothetical protein
MSRCVSPHAPLVAPPRGGLVHASRTDAAVPFEARVRLANREDHGGTQVRRVDQAVICRADALAGHLDGATFGEPPVIVDCESERSCPELDCADLDASILDDN